MEFIKIIEWASKYLADYFAVLTSTLQDPVPAYKPLKRNKTQKVNPKLMGFALISIALGATINSVIPNRPANAEVFTTSIVTLIMWIVYSMVIFAMSAMLGSKVHLLEITTISLQLFGTVYVISNLAAFLWGIASINPFIYQLVSRIDTFRLVADNPLMVFYFIQIIILTVYIPKVLAHLYNSNGSRIILTTVASVLFIFTCGISPYLSTLLLTNHSTTVMAFYNMMLPTPATTNTHAWNATAMETVTAAPVAVTTSVNGTASSTPISTMATPTLGYFEIWQTLTNLPPIVGFITNTPMSVFPSPNPSPTPTPTNTKIVVVFTLPASDTPTFTPTPSLPRECNDGVDNDGDGLVDFPADLQCRNIGDDDESQ